MLRGGGQSSIEVLVVLSGTSRFWEIFSILFGSLIATFFIFLHVFRGLASFSPMMKNKKLALLEWCVLSDL